MGNADFRAGPVCKMASGLRQICIHNSSVMQKDDAPAVCLATRRSTAPTLCCTYVAQEPACIHPRPLHVQTDADRHIFVNPSSISKTQPEANNEQTCSQSCLKRIILPCLLSFPMAPQRPNATEHKRIVQEICHGDSPRFSSADFEAFIQFYMNTSTSHNFHQSEHGSIFTTHADIMKAVLFLRQNASLSKTSFQDQAFGGANQLKEYAARITVKIAFMIDCSSKDDFSDSYHLCGSFPVKWTATQNFVEFLQGAFPTTKSRPFHAQLSNRSIKAWKLKERYGVRLEPTNDLVQHLLYDRHASAVKVFHQAAFIKAHLSHTEKLPLNTEFSNSVQKYVSLRNSVTWISQWLKSVLVVVLCHHNFF